MASELPPPAYEDEIQLQEVQLHDFDSIVRKYEIDPYFSRKLRLLHGFDIVFICDDSGSMNTPVDCAGHTRWNEEERTVGPVMEIGSVLDSDGIDVYFLNRPTIRNVTSLDVVRRAFKHPPTGATPINRVLLQVLADKSRSIVEKKLLIIIATDGEPTNSSDKVDKEELRRTLLGRYPIDRIHITFVACTDDIKAIEYLNEWDGAIPYLDVVDDYQSEKKEILKHQGQDFKFSYGDWIVKILLGSIDPELDDLDEAPIRSGASKEGNEGCCALM